MSAIPRARRIYTNRTLNLRAIRAIGFDMDYTLIHYEFEAWERHTFSHALHLLEGEGWAVHDLKFDPKFVIRGLVVDTELGNLVKANRFGFIKQAYHGTQPLSYQEIRETYARTTVDLSEGRWQFLNTLFSVSDGCLYGQLVDRVDRGENFAGISNYAELYAKVRASVDLTHLEGHLKGDIMADPERFVDLDPDTVLALQDLKHAGKKLLLITNSDWVYTNAMMTHAFDRFLPGGTQWRDLFDVVIVDARKPAFFTQKNPLYQVATQDGLLRPVVRTLEEGSVYSGGDAGLVERWLGVEGEEVLYVGDHIFSDVNVSKNIQRWRTALVLRELEAELEAIESFESRQAKLRQLMEEKDELETSMCQLRVQLQRLEHGYGPKPDMSREEIEQQLEDVKAELEAKDAEVAPLAKAAASLSSENWGLLLRTGNDKSHLARQVERYADIYTSRVSNFFFHGPYAYLRSARGSLPHDPTTA